LEFDDQIAAGSGSNNENYQMRGDIGHPTLEEEQLRISGPRVEGTSGGGNSRRR